MLLRWLLLAVALLGLLFYSISRDIRYEKTMAGDLRNRVTGARLVKDGRSPYFYKWKPEDGLRYYDPANFDSALASNMTSTPILYRLMSPGVDAPESTISKAWLVIQYGILAIIAFFAFQRARTPTEQQVVLLTSALLLLTNSWKSHVYLGQTYLLIPLFGMLFLVCLEKNDHPAWGLAAGAAAVCMVGIRFNTVLFFLPFLPLMRFYTRRWLLFFLLPIALTAAWILTSPHERMLWREYGRNISEAIKVNQRLVPPVVNNPPDPRYPEWEGIDIAETVRYNRNLPAPIYSENGNFFVLYRGITHRHLSVAVLGCIAFVLVAVGAGFFLFLHHRPGKPDIAKAAVFGCCLFMIPDLFSPIYRHQYYTVQWFLPLLLVAAHFSTLRRTEKILLLIALILWCIHIPGLKMQNTLAEYGFLALLSALSLRPRGFSISG